MKRTIVAALAAAVSIGAIASPCDDDVTPDNAKCIPVADDAYWILHLDSVAYTTDLRSAGGVFSIFSKGRFIGTGRMLVDGCLRSAKKEDRRYSLYNGKKVTAKNVRWDPYDLRTAGEGAATIFCTAAMESSNVAAKGKPLLDPTTEKRTQAAETQRRQKDAENARRKAALEQARRQSPSALEDHGISGSAISDRNGRARVLQDPPPRGGAALRPGESFRDCPECPEMVVVPAGRFLMGSPQEEQGRTEAEGPQHEVVIKDAFAVAKYEARFDEWELCVGNGACRAVEDFSWGRGARPVINVSHDDAKAYAEWLSKRTGKRYRLLSEAEWEYAARAGTTSAYPWGNDPGTNQANFHDSGSEWWRKRTAPVGSFAPNPFGLHDMIGNVEEWTEDCYHDSYEGAPRDGRAWKSDQCSAYVLRGGNCYHSPQDARSARRSVLPPGYRSGVLGIRLARTLP